MSDTSTHYLGRNSVYNDDPGCLPLCLGTIAGIIICAILTFVIGCSGSKDVTKESSYAVYTVENVSDSLKKTITITKTDTTVTYIGEVMYTDITFTTTEYDTIGHRIKVTEGSISKEQTKNGGSKSFSKENKSEDHTNVNYASNSEIVYQEGSSHEKEIPSTSFVSKGWFHAIRYYAVIIAVLILLYICARKGYITKYLNLLKKK